MKTPSSILIISPESWGFLFVSKHHYALELAKNGHHVYFLNPPSNTIDDISIETTEHQNIWQVNSSAVAKGLRFYPKLLRRILEMRWLKQLEHKAERTIDCIWLFENSRFFDMKFAGQRLKIYHQVDMSQNFNPTKAAKTADICFCTSDFIKDVLLPFNSKTYKIHHGFHNLPRSKLNTQQHQLFEKNHINAAYIGNLDISFLDTSAISQLAKKHSNISFHLVGKANTNNELVNELKAQSNVFFWGKVASSLIPSILEQCDIQLLCYKSNNDEAVKQLSSPHKLMEYLASGKVTIASYTDEYKDKRHLLAMAEKNQTIEPIFENVVNHLAQFNSPENQQQRIEFAGNHSYAKQLGEIKKLLTNNNL